MYLFDDVAEVASHPFVPSWHLTFAAALDVLPLMHGAVWNLCVPNQSFPFPYDARLFVLAHELSMLYILFPDVSFKRSHPLSTIIFCPLIVPPLSLSQFIVPVVMFAPFIVVLPSLAKSEKVTNPVIVISAFPDVVSIIFPFSSYSRMTIPIVLSPPVAVNSILCAVCDIFDDNSLFSFCRSVTSVSIFSSVFSILTVTFLSSSSLFCDSS